MHKRLIIASFFYTLSPTYTNALDCGDQEEISKSYSLRSPGESLENMRTQAQGPLGTCYANALSLVLEAKIGKQISVQHLAMNSKDLKSDALEKNKLMQTKTKINFDGKPLIDEDGDIVKTKEIFYHGGYFCHTLNKSKDKTVCTRENSPIESYIDQGALSVIKPLSNLYDFIGPHSDLDEREKYEIALIDYFTIIEDEIEQQCIDYSQNIEIDLPTDNEGMAAMLFDKIIKNEYQTFNNIWHAYFNFQKKGDLELLEQIKANLQKSREKLKHFAAIDDPRLDPNINPEDITPDKFTPPMGHGEPAPDIKWNYSKDFDSIMRTYIHKLPSLRAIDDDEDKKKAMSNIFLKESFTENMNPYLLKNYKELIKMHLGYTIYLDYKTFDPEKCKSRILDGSHSYQKVRDFYEQTHQLCVTDNFLVMQHTVFRSLMKLNPNFNGLSKDVSSIIDKFDPDMKKYLMNVINEDCINKVPGTFVNLSRKKIECKNVKWNYPNNGGNKKRKIKRAKKALNKNVQKQLRTKKNPVAIDICTNFFSDPNADSDFTKNCDRSKRHGMHAVVIIGSRCNKGQVEYQIQNSWGNSCSYYVSSKNKTLYDCNPEEGNIWVPENVLVPNIEGVHYLK